MGERFQVAIEGGRPWGFTIMGGSEFRSPLRVGKVTPGGRAAKAGLVAGDYVLSINGKLTAGLRHLEAKQLVVNASDIVELLCCKHLPLVTTPTSPASFTMPSPVANGGKQIPTPRPRIPSVSISKPKPLGTQPAKSTSVVHPPPTPLPSTSHPHTVAQPEETPTETMITPEVQENGAPTSVDLSEWEVIEEPNTADFEVFQETNPAELNQAVIMPTEEEGRRDEEESGEGEEECKNVTDTEDLVPYEESPFTDEAVPVMQAVAPPTEEAIPVVQVEAPPTEEAIPVVQVEAPPTEEAIPVVQVEAPPTEEAIPVVQVEAPLTEEAIPVVQVEAPPTEEVIPVVQVEAPPTEEDVPVIQVEAPPTEEVVPVVQVEAPPTEEVVPVVQVEAPPTEEDVPVVQVEAPPTEEVVPVVQVEAPPIEEVVPVVQVEAPPTEEVVPVVHVEMESICQDTPTWEVVLDQDECPQEGEVPVCDEVVSPQDDLLAEEDQGSRGAPVAEAPVDIVAQEDESDWRKDVFAKVDSEGKASSDVVEETEEEEPTYEFDYRGLRVRTGSSGQVTTTPAEDRQPVKSPEDEEEPTYELDYRGLRVRTNSSEKVVAAMAAEGQAGTLPEEATASSDATITNKVVEETDEEEPRYEFDYRGLRVRTGSSGQVAAAPAEDEGRPGPSPEVMSTEDVLVASKRQTSFKTGHPEMQERAEGSRDYWKKIDQDHSERERERERRNSRDQVDAAPITSEQYHSKTMHPLLMAAAEQDSTEESHTDSAEVSADIFSRIDASKLHGAMENATMLQQLESAGVPSTMLPLKTEPEPQPQIVKRTKKKPPPGEKARSLFDFDAQSEKELAFKKGDIIDLTYTIDANWLEGVFEGRKGIFPTAFVQVLTSEQLETPPPAKPQLQAVAEYDFEAQGKREISFSKGDVLTITRTIDANWFEGMHGEVKGIFPCAYVTVLEEF